VVLRLVFLTEPWSALISPLLCAISLSLAVPESWQRIAADRKSAKLLKATQHAPDIGRVAGAQRVHMSVA